MMNVVRGYRGDDGMGVGSAITIQLSLVPRAYLNPVELSASPGEYTLHTSTDMLAGGLHVLC